MPISTPLSSDFFITHLILFLSQAPFGVYVVLARGSVGNIWPGVLVVLRFAGGAVMLLTYQYVVTGRNMLTSLVSLHQRLKWQVLLSGVVAALSPIAFVFGLRHTSAVVAGAIDASCPAVAVLVALVLGTEPLRAADWACLVLSLVGNAFVLEIWPVLGRLLSAPSTPSLTAAPLPQDHDAWLHGWYAAWGVFLVFLSAVLSVANYNIQRPIMRMIPAIDLVTYVVVVGFCVSLLMAFTDLGAFGVLLEPQSTMSWVMLTYAVLLQGWSHNLLVSMAVHRSSPILVSMYTTLIPAISSSLAYLWLHEHVSPMQVLGMILVTLSVCASAVTKSDQNKEEVLEKKAMSL